MSRVMIFVHPSLDLFDSLYDARVLGQEAGLKGHVKGENPCECECHRAQWDHGWDEGNALFLRTRRVVTVLPRPEHT